MKEFQRCNRCVMDNSSDNTITFDEKGNCNYCTYALERRSTVYFPNKEGENKLQSMLSEIKENSKDNDYDCIMGVSGGLDSSYLLYLGHKWGLRILAFHIDDGFNSKVAEENIKKLCDKCNIELMIEKPDHEQFTDVTKAFMLAGLPGLCIPQDNVIISYLYKNAKKYEVKNFLSGANFALESILQRDSNGANASDGYHIRAISKQFGEKGVDKLPLMTLFKRYVMLKYTRSLKTFRPLDFIDYNKERAIKELQEFSGFEYYGGKHYESILTYFNQAYYLPNKFKQDKRTSHLSSLIVDNQITRSEAIKELEKPIYNSDEMKEYIDIILEKMNFTRIELEKIMSATPKSHSDYSMSFYSNFANVARKYRKYLND